MDAVDAVLADFASLRPTTIAALTYPIPASLRSRLRAAASPDWRGDLDEFGHLDTEVGELFAEAARALLDHAGIPAAQITAIGSHGQTLRHRPDTPHPFSLQIGDPSLIAERTGITVVGDFRRRDIAAGGQGAPLVPAFHARMFGSPHEWRAVLNLGGIANLTCLPPGDASTITGFDIGPANTLLDAWARLHLNQPFDVGGEWAATGQVIQPLLESMLADPYFDRCPPKSTGPEYFNAEWVSAALAKLPSQCPADIQRTLVELTAATVGTAIKRHAPLARTIYICGGGVHNQLLMKRIGALLEGQRVTSTLGAGIDPDYVEALAFAWLASRTLSGLPGNLPSVTGASHPVILGAIHRTR